MNPDSPRQWTGSVHLCEDHRMQDCALCGVHDVVQVVEESRLREVEAERDKWRARALAELPERLDAVESVERLEADLQEAREALEWIVTHADMPAGEPWEAAYNEVVERARGVLRKGDTDAR